MGMSSLSTPISGLQAAQAGLFVTGHNMANQNVRGFTRQMVGQGTFTHRNIGRDVMGAMQIGLGTNITGIRQVRDHFLDIRWRGAAPELNFWDVRVNTGMRLDAIFGELEGEFRLQGVLRDLNRAMHELNNEAPSIESRGNFISFAGTFISRVGGAFTALNQRQMELNNNVASSVRRINQLLTDIDELNRRIVFEEIGGSNANDFRDWRNNYIDELAQLININVREDSRGNINIISNGHPILVNGHRMHMGLQYTVPGSLFVCPVFTESDEILAYDVPVTRFFDWETLATRHELPPHGALLSMIVSRGLSTANYTTPGPPAPTDFWDVFNMNHGVIPQVQAQLDTLVNTIVRMFNDAITVPHPQHGLPVNLAGHHHGQVVNGVTQDLRLFVEIQPGGGFTMGNIRINPNLLVQGGSSRLPLNFDGPDDNRLVGQLIEQWGSAVITMPQLGTLGDPFVNFPGWYGQSIDGFYRNFIDNMSTMTATARGYLQTSIEEMNFLDNRRMEISAVSLEEEMSNMIRFQHAYNASARMINTLDSMLDRIINQTGRVGL